MLNAIDLAVNGVQVTYVVQTKELVQHAIKRLRSLTAGLSGHVVVTSISEIEAKRGGFNWHTMRPNDSRDPRAGSVYIVDHSVAESEHQRLALEIARLQTLQQQIYPMTTGVRVHAIGENVLRGAKVE